MGINIRIRDGMCPDPTTGDGGATEGDIRGSFSDIIDTIGVKDLAGGHALVTQNSPAALSVLVAPGVVYIPNADYNELDSNQVKFWEAVITASTAVAITANTSGSTRIDLICVKMDTAVTPDEHASNIATLVAVAGTPGAGVPATPDNYAKLAEIEVANGASTIVNADITDSRVQSTINSDYITIEVTPTSITTFTGKTFDDELRLKQIVKPTNPASGYNKIYVKSDDKVYKLTSAGVESEIGASNVDGWTPANETWTYASATTITVPTGAASKYSKGDKIKLTQTTVKYFYIVGVADTVLTITGGSSYTLTSETISANYYSHQASPVGFPSYFNYTPTITTTGGSVTTSQNAFRFYILGSIVYIPQGSFSFSASSGTGAVLITLPVTSANTEYILCGNKPASIGYGLIVGASSTSIMQIYKYDGTSIAGITGEYWKINGFYNF